jgi:D-glycero-alpha-D-manno-heptose 1-phosphate guanylyltransferase
MKQITEALILAGGFGTRLQHILKDVPKPLAPINGEPFLSILMRFLIRQGIERIILAVGYRYDAIQNLYGSEFNGASITYSIETTPLGTGGAIALGLSQAHNERVLVVNGDSFIDFSLSALEKVPLQPDEILLLLKPMQNFERYGCVEISQDSITAFREKQFVSDGLINSGVYLLPRNLFVGKEGQKFSFENDFLENEVANTPFRYHICDNYFIDIGIEEDYRKAQSTLSVLQ